MTRSADDSPREPDPGAAGPARRDHVRPRSRRARILICLFVALFALAQWPALAAANRIEPTVAGMPFLFVYLLVLYTAMIGVLIMAAWWEL